MPVDTELATYDIKYAYWNIQDVKEILDLLTRVRGTSCKMGLRDVALKELNHLEHNLKGIMLHLSEGKDIDWPPQAKKI